MKITTIHFPSVFRLLSIVFLAATLFVLPTSCNKQAADEELQEMESATAAAAVEEDAPPERYEYYLDSKQVKEGDFDPEDKKLIINVTGEPDPEVKGGGLIKIWAFTSEETYFDWGEFYGMPVKCRWEMQKHLADYAETSGAIEYYERTGKLLPEYEKYSTEYAVQMDCSIEKSGERGLAVLHKDFFGGSSWFIFTFKPFMYGGWNNQTSRYMTFGIYNAFGVFDRSFYRNHMATIWNWGWANWRFWEGLSWLDNRLSSAFSL